jgi:hypothetical protein
MRGMISEPTRLRERHDQSDLALRIAGQAARDTALPAPLSRAAMARIASRIEAGRSKGRGLPSLGWAMVIGAFLLGIVTAASAAHLDLLPGWLTRIVPGTAKRPSNQTALATARRRAPAQKQAPTTTVPLAAAEKPEAPPAPSVSVKAPEVKPIPDPRLLEPGQPRLRKIAMLADRPPVSHPSRPARPLRRPEDVATSGNAIRGQPELPVAMPWPPSSPAEEQGASVSSRESKSEGTPDTAFPPERPSSSVGVAAPTPSAVLPEIVATPSRPPQTASVLKEIVRSLRVEHAPRRALALLDRHGAELAGQAFAEESLLLRVEAMLALGQRAAVLRLLDRTALSDLSVSSTLLLTRGELRAAARRCAEGIGDFDLVLADSRRPPKAALLGRARCKQQVGDQAGAQADFDRYRREFPGVPER